MATSSDSVTGSAATAGSPFSQIPHVSSWLANVGPYRLRAASTISPTVEPDISVRPVPAATRAEANKRSTAIR